MTSEAIYQWSVAVLILVGSLFSLLAAVGLLRMPDLYMRIQAATKSSTLGVSCLVLAVALRLRTTETATEALLVIAFLFLTAPVAAHMIGRAAYAAGVPLWEQTILDELGTAGGEDARPPAHPVLGATDDYETDCTSRDQE